jgi:hypothetical protein
MGRSRVVQPEVVRLPLADVHRRTHEVLINDGVTENDGKTRPATAEEIARSAARVAAADADADWIEVKRRLNTGETRALFERTYVRGPDGKLTVNLAQQGIAKVTAYLLDWSILGLDGKVIPIAGKSIAAVTSALDSIDPESFHEIREAIDAHEEAMQAEREQVRSFRAGGTGAPTISPLPSVVTGASNGFEN